MKKFVLALAILALAGGDALAGCGRSGGLFHRLRDRRAAHGQTVHKPAAVGGCSATGCTRP